MMTMMNYYCNRLNVEFMRSKVVLKHTMKSAAIDVTLLVCDTDTTPFPHEHKGQARTLDQAQDVQQRQIKLKICSNGTELLMPSAAFSQRHLRCESVTTAEPQ